MICHMCINRLKHKNLTAPAEEPAVANQELPATNDPIANCVWDDVIVSTSQTNMAQRQKKGEQMIFKLDSSSGLLCQWCGAAFGIYLKGFFEEVGNHEGQKQGKISFKAEAMQSHC
jgi:hypothetical protein